jgi:hypothetical protein
LYSAATFIVACGSGKAVLVVFNHSLTEIF